MSLPRSNKKWVVNQDGSRGCVWEPIGGMREEAENRSNPEERPRNSTRHIIAVERLAEPYRLKKQSRILTCFKTDLFSPQNRENWIGEILFCMANNHRHEFIIVTSYAKSLMRWTRFIPRDNVYLGAKVRRQEDVEGVFWLRMVDAKVRFVLFESLKEPVRLDLLNLDWVIFDNSKANSFSSDECVRPLVEQARTMKISIFLNGNLHYCEKIQEFPETK